MSVAAISAIPRVAAPYPARIPMLDDTRPTWETERAAQSYAARQAQRAAQAQAAWEAQRIARAQAAKAASAGPETSPSHHRNASPRTPLALATSADIDGLRNLYAESRMRRAVEDFAAQPDPLAQRAGNANDLGTIEGLAPLQPYRVAMGNPQVQELQTAVAMKAAGIGIPKVANIGATENVTDNARYRPGNSP
ncbi:hypothetical protein [Achromobacter deleyi]|uniref:hypothetical protein n=1 Tax=Achromobacter deleyi TaxID=1353891 RepID=UPI001491B79D|nr:hypothetical protein [Achromobacter deleyi]QVQ25871.1 hypothetical protein HLG70_23875 [Achromobacter deleyi]UIP21411.1 hypothetical protein LYZ39_02540 [Achromobacter deleyi]